jgi:dTDP-4-amino-4,6-dideoxygalactose transaminase
MPIFADVCEETLNIDPTEIEKKITARTRAILPVDYAGHPADLSPIKELATQHKLTVIEDASHALGARYKQRRVGSISHMTVFSFHPVKHITTGEGGMVTTNDPEFDRRLKTFRNHGITSDSRTRQQQVRWQYEMVALGCNYRLSDIGAALGLSQLQRIEANLERRRQIAAKYHSAFADLPELIRPAKRGDVEHAWHLYPVRLRLDALRVGRNDIFRALRAENIGVNVHYIPVYQHPYYRARFPYTPSCPVTEAAYESLLTLPLFPAMSDSDVGDVISAVRKVVNHYRR